MIALRLHRRQRRRPIEIVGFDQVQPELHATPPPAALPTSAIGRLALPSPRRLPRRPTWASPDRVARIVADAMRIIAKPHISHNRLAAHVDRRLRRATSPAGELDRIRRELAEVGHWVDYLPRHVDDLVHAAGGEYAEDYEPLRERRAIAARIRTGGDAR